MNQNNNQSFDPLALPVSAGIIEIALEVFTEEDIVAAAERIFGAKAVDMTDEQKRQFDLAQKYNALVWQALPTVGGKVGIKVLVEVKK